MKHLENTLQKLDDDLKTIDAKEKESVQKSKHVVAECIKCLDQMKNHVLEHGFESEEHEIRFFRNIKPSALSRLLFHASILKIETTKGLYAGETLLAYYRKHLEHIAKFASENEAFIHYYNSGSNSLDKSYFTRHASESEFHYDPNLLYTDPSFSTHYDHKVALILANESFVGYLNSKISLELIALRGERASAERSEFKWTGSKAALVEIVYAFQAAGSINNGKSDIGDVAAHFEKTLNVSLGDIYRKFHDMKDRKSSRTRFLDQLIASLNKKLDEE